MSVAKRDVPGVIRTSYQGDIGYVAGLLILSFIEVTGCKKNSCPAPLFLTPPPPPHTHKPLLRSCGDSPQTNQEQVDALLEFRDCQEVSYTSAAALSAGLCCVCCPSATCIKCV
jgi:hypothetical protein